MAPAIAAQCVGLPAGYLPCANARLAAAQAAHVAAEQRSCSCPGMLLMQSTEQCMLLLLVPPTPKQWSLLAGWTSHSRAATSVSAAAAPNFARKQLQQVEAFKTSGSASPAPQLQQPAAWIVSSFTPAVCGSICCSAAVGRTAECFHSRAALLFLAPAALLQCTLAAVAPAAACSCISASSSMKQCWCCGCSCCCC